MTDTSRKKVLVAMSGGVDSSVAALLLQQQGYEVAGVTMHFTIDHGHGEILTHPETCVREDAKQVCSQLGINHHDIDLSHEMHHAVIENFIAEYRAGRTPNPCVLCNRHLKFGALLRMARHKGFDFLATGHYARIRHDNHGVFLSKAIDPEKDQTYFLYYISPGDLRSIMFPLGALTKQETRKIARDFFLPVAHKRESQDICFVGRGDYRSFFGTAADNNGPGRFVSMDGIVLGTHNGITGYTTGQRKGLGVTAGKPLYVVRIDGKKNVITLGDRHDLMSCGCTVVQINRFVDPLPRHANIKIRSTHAAVPCTLYVKGNEVVVRFDKPQEAVTPGQSAVWYTGDLVAGGGIIHTTQ